LILSYHLTPGQTHESTVLDVVLENADKNLLDSAGVPVPWPVRLAGDKGYRADWIDDCLMELEVLPVIPSKSNEDHIHIACTLPRTVTQAKLLEETKKGSSIWMKQQQGGLRHFSWQAGYGIFSLGQSQLPTLIQYIDNQEEHHRTKSFKEELLELLEKYDVEYDEKYLWD